MRKLTALTVALSLSATGQLSMGGAAFAGEHHAPAAHAPAAHAPAKAVGQAVEKKAIQNVYQKTEQIQQQAQTGQAREQAQAAITILVPAVEKLAKDEVASIQQQQAEGCNTCTVGENVWLGARIEDKAGEIKAKIDDAKMTEAEKIDAKKTEVIDTANTVKTADAPNSGGAIAAATAESQNGK